MGPLKVSFLGMVLSSLCSAFLLTFTCTTDTLERNCFGYFSYGIYHSISFVIFFLIVLKRNC